MKRVSFGIITMVFIFLAPFSEGSERISGKELNALEGPVDPFSFPQEAEPWSQLVAINSDAPLTSLEAELTDGFPIDLLSTLWLAGGNDLEVQYVREVLREAYADEQLASVRCLPTIGVIGEFLKHEGRIQGTVGDLPVASKQSLFTGVGVSWVYDTSEIRYGILAARQTRQAQQAELESTREQKLFEAAVRYFDLVGAHAGQRVAEESVRRGEALIEYQKDIVERGKGLEADVARAEAFWAEQALGLTDARAKKQIASLDLATQLDLDLFSMLIPAETAVLPVDFVSDHQSREQLVGKALSTRPEIQREGYAIGAANTLRTAAAKKRYLPVITGEARVGAFGGDNGSGLEKFDDRQDYRLGIEWSTDHLGKGDRAVLAQRDAQLAQANTRRDQVENEVTQEVLSAIVQVEKTSKQISLAREQVEAASASLSITGSRLKGGLAIPYEVIRAQEDLVRAQNNQVNAIIEFNKAEIWLLRSLGGLRTLAKR